MHFSFYFRCIECNTISNWTSRDVINHSSYWWRHSGDKSPDSRNSWIVSQQSNHQWTNGCNIHIQGLFSEVIFIKCLENSNRFKSNKWVIYKSLHNLLLLWWFVCLFWWVFPALTHLWIKQGISSKPTSTHIWTFQHSFSTRKIRRCQIFWI